MTDIVERLLDRNNPENRWVMRTEAAAEIERLRADNHKLMLWNEQLQADLDAARRALEPKP